MRINGLDLIDSMPGLGLDMIEMTPKQKACAVEGARIIKEWFDKNKDKMPEMFLCESLPNNYGRLPEGYYGMRSSKRRFAIRHGLNAYDVLNDLPHAFDRGDAIEFPLHNSANTV